MIKKYKKKDGSTAYMFVAYLGTDPITGKQKRTTRRGFKTEREAKIEEARLQTEISQNGFANNDITTFKEVYKLWLEQYKNTVRDSTYNQITVLFRTAILEHFEDLAIKKITIPYCQKVMNKWNKKYKNISNKKVYTSLVFEYAINLKIINDNPFKYIKAPRKKEEQRDDTLDYYTSEELKEFLSFVKDNPLHHAIFRTLAFTGIRRGELLALTWDDIDFNNKTININKTFATVENSKCTIHKPKTKSSNRLISIDDKTISILKEWRIYQRVESLKHGHNTSDKHQHVFTKVTNNKVLCISYCNETLNLICKKHNFKRIKVHGFRHTHCSLLIEAGMSIQEVQNRLGHGDIKVTMNIYAHFTEKQREKVAEKFANYIDF